MTRSTAPDEEDEEDEKEEEEEEEEEEEDEVLEIATTGHDRLFCSGSYLRHFSFSPVKYK